MKKVFVLGWIGLIGAGLCFAADPAEGYWLSLDEKTGKVTAGWEIYQSNNKLYGKVLSSAVDSEDARAHKCRETYREFPVPGKVNEMPLVGTPWIFGLTLDRPGQWKDGSVVDPTTGNVYKCSIVFHAADGGRYKVDTLEMRGEIGLGLGRSQFWQRASREIAGAQRPPNP
jgi:uncharacterized protein (DUF2147 family)